MPNQTGVKNKYEKGIRIKLFFAFFKIGLFTFGGGYAMLPLIHTDIVENRKWMSDEEMTDILAISQSAPGAFAINVSAFVGSRLGGFGGAAAAALGSSLPSFIVILIVSYLFGELRTNPFVDAAFAGVRAGVVVLIINAVIKLAAKLKWKGSVCRPGRCGVRSQRFYRNQRYLYTDWGGYCRACFSLVNALRQRRFAEMIFGSFSTRFLKSACLRLAGYAMIPLINTEIINKAGSAGHRGRFYRGFESTRAVRGKYCDLCRK